MNKDTLSPGWTGNKSRHHMKIEGYTLKVERSTHDTSRWVCEIWVTSSLKNFVLLRDYARYISAEEARDACKRRLRDHLSRALRLLG
jgi:hypothetical protein